MQQNLIVKLFSSEFSLNKHSNIVDNIDTKEGECIPTRQSFNFKRMS
jgi:hypothetical protein